MGLSLTYRTSEENSEKYIRKLRSCFFVCPIKYINGEETSFRKGDKNEHLHEHWYGTYHWIFAASWYLQVHGE